MINVLTCLQILIEATAGSSFTGDIAIDNVNARPTECSGTNNICQVVCSFCDWTSQSSQTLV